MAQKNVDPATVTELAECPSSPNCVSSAHADDSHYIEPISIAGDPDSAWRTLRDLLEAKSNTTITASGDHYIRAEATTTLLRFTDDVEFLLKREAGRIDMRSASRLGYWDLGKNRKRLESIRSEMQESGTAVKPE